MTPPLPCQISWHSEDGLYWITDISRPVEVGVLVTDPIYYAPLAQFQASLQPGVNYWFQSPPANPHPGIPTLRFLVQDLLSSNRWEIFQNLTLGTYQKRIDARLDDSYTSGDGFFHFRSNLFSNAEDWIFPSDSDGWFVDLGANLGSYTLLALSLGFNKCLAVEPTPDLAASLRRTFRTFEEVRVAEVAVTNSPSSTVNFSNRYFWSVENRVVPDSEAQNLDRVPNARLVDLIQEHSIDRISLLKMDIEGAEEEVILGLEDDVWSRIDRLHLEIHQMYGVQGDSLIAYVTQQGFEVLDFKDRSPILEILFQKIIPGTDFS